MNTKNKRIEVRVTNPEKEKMESYAEHCGLSLSEYLRQGGLGYEPRPLLHDGFYQFYRKLCDLCNQPMTAETEAALVALITDIRKELMLPQKRSRKEVAAWLRPDSGQSKGG